MRRSHCSNPVSPTAGCPRSTNTVRCAGRRVPSQQTAREDGGGGHGDLPFACTICFNLVPSCTTASAVDARASGRVRASNPPQLRGSADAEHVPPGGTGRDRPCEAAHGAAGLSGTGAPQGAEPLSSSSSSSSSSAPHLPAPGDTESSGLSDAPRPARPASLRPGRAPQPVSWRRPCPRGPTHARAVLQTPQGPVRCHSPSGTSGSGIHNRPPRGDTTETRGRLQSQEQGENIDPSSDGTLAALVLAFPSGEPASCPVRDLTCAHQQGCHLPRHTHKQCMPGRPLPAKDRPRPPHPCAFLLVQSVSGTQVEMPTCPACQGRRGGSEHCSPWAARRTATPVLGIPPSPVAQAGLPRVNSGPLCPQERAHCFPRAAGRADKTLSFTGRGAGEAGRALGTLSARLGHKREPLCLVVPGGHWSPGC